MELTFYDFIGAIGIVLIIVTYFLLQLDKMKSSELSYSLLNAIGSALVIVSLVYRFNLSAFIVEAFCLLISFVGIIRFVISKNRITGTNRPLK